MKNQELKVVVPCCKSYEFVLLKDIVRCEGLQSYTRIFLMGNKSIISSYSIGVMRSKLEKYNFFHCHKSHLINADHVERYYKTGELEMIDQSKVPVARRRREDFVSKIIDKMSI